MKKARAFTLIELLVVVAIIALLISILLPSLKEARALGKAVACSANLKNMGNAMRMYLDENGGFYPCGHAIRSRDSIISWAPRMLKYLAKERRVFKCQEVEESVYIVPEYTNNSRFTNPMTVALGYEPGERAMMGDRIGGRLEFFSYGYNESGSDPIISYDNPCIGIGVHARPNVTAAIEGEVNEKVVRNPSQLIVIGDVVVDGEWDQWLNPHPGNFFAGPPADRHQQGSNMLFADGHAQKFKRHRLTPQAYNLETGQIESDFIDEAIMRLWNVDFEAHRERW